MKSIRSIKETHPDVGFYQLNNKDVEVKTRYVASKIVSDVEWLQDKAIRVPQSLISFVKSKQVFQSRGDIIANASRHKNALTKLIPCVITGVIESAKFFYDDEPDKVFFEDVLIAQPQDNSLDGLYIYIYQSLAGHFQPSSVVKMVGEVVPVRIYSLHRVHQGQRYNSFKFDPKEAESLLDQYVVLGDIDTAEYLTGLEVLNNLEIPRKDDPIFDVQEGIITHISDNGFFVLTKRLERVFIQNKRFSYKYRSRVYNDNYASMGAVGQIIKFKFLRAKIQVSNDSYERRGIQGQAVVIEGERLSIEVKPEEVMINILNSGRGTVMSGTIVEYDVVKGHLFEPEGAYGYQIRMTHNPQITLDRFKKRCKVSAVLETGKYSWHTNKESGTEYIKVRARCHLNSYYSNGNLFSNFFGDD